MFWHRSSIFFQYSVFLLCRVRNTSEFFNSLASEHASFLDCGLFYTKPPKYVPSVLLQELFKCTSLSKLVLTQLIMGLHLAASVVHHDILGPSAVYHIPSCLCSGLGDVSFCSLRPVSLFSELVS